MSAIIGQRKHVNLTLNYKGESPLHLAAREGNCEVYKFNLLFLTQKVLMLLIRSLADDHAQRMITEPSYAGLTPQQYAKSRGHLDCVDLLARALEWLRTQPPAEN